MRIAFFQFFPPTLWTPGGGELQLQKTKEALERRGVEVILFDPWSRSRDFDILHVFGSTYEVSSFVRSAKGLGIRVVQSVIMLSGKPAWQRRFWKYVDPLVPLPTTYRLRKQMYAAADILVCASHGELDQLQHDFSVPRGKIRLVPHGIDGKKFAQADPRPFTERYGIKDFVLEVARVSDHKGQKRLIQALRGTGLKLVFIGALDPSDPQGSKEFLDLVENNKDYVYYLGAIPHESHILAAAYAAARVHVLPSWTESPGLATLEALAAGAAAVSGRYATTVEYLGDFVYYCDPNSIVSIRKAVLEAYEKGPIAGAREFVLSNFSWDKAAEKLESIYMELLNGATLS